MKANINEFPKRPLPHVPPQEPQRPRVQPPSIFVYEKQGWEHKVISKDTASDALMTEDELNALGNDGWELVGVVQLPGRVQFYLKRIRG